MARMTTDVTKWVSIPNDPDRAKIQLRIIRPGIKRRLQVQGVVLTSGLSEEGEAQAPTFQMPDATDMQLNWMMAAFASWDGFYGKDNAPITVIDKDAVLFFQDALEIEYHALVNAKDPETKKPIEGELVEEKRLGTLFEWAVEEYVKFEKEHEEQKEVAEKN